MPRPISAGTVLYREGPDGLEVLLVHPSGNYNRKAPWSIPKGLPEAGESLEAAARRETREETGVEPGPLVDIGTVDYRRSRKTIHAFAGPLPAGAQPHVASWEVDRAEMLPLEEARRLIHPDQAPLLDRIPVSVPAAPRS
ncbi:MAG: NUDIX domain-containing protein [Deltaproteobacteria bacterium]|nr:MAG: NUDIX domain-containing protein [Deltaproteobacteria bacterium]